MEEAADFVGIMLRLAETAQLHAQDDASLYRDAELTVALQWKAVNHPTTPWAARYHAGFASAMEFLEKSRRARDLEAEEMASPPTKIGGQKVFLRWLVNCDLDHIQIK